MCNSKPIITQPLNVHTYVLYGSEWAIRRVKGADGTASNYVCLSVWSSDKLWAIWLMNEWTFQEYTHWSPEWRTTTAVSSCSPVTALNADAHSVAMQSYMSERSKANWAKPGFLHTWGSSVDRNHAPLRHLNVRNVLLNSSRSMSSSSAQHSISARAWCQRTLLTEGTVSFRH